ncbi:hypothetical protein KP77_12100 [Jeotgalibacillus alimentarius]|uniref:Uncharacterized protein n=1 Tax=Jeotgalibacillus alimentarius TaxID=135826 RepID=A0A0C2W6N6_9BACL|nr:hypothetical protein KP77_12100 [Jeotgalibacillus alimentarius]
MKVKACAINNTEIWMREDQASVIDRRFPLEQAREAQVYLKNKGKLGTSPLLP